MPDEDALEEAYGWDISIFEGDDTYILADERFPVGVIPFDEGIEYKARIEDTERTVEDIVDEGDIEERYPDPYSGFDQTMAVLSWDQLQEKLADTELEADTVSNLM